MKFFQVHMCSVHCVSAHGAARNGTFSTIWASSERGSAVACAWRVSCSEVKWEPKGELEDELGNRNTGRTTGREHWGTRRNMKTVAGDKSAGWGDTAALWPGNSPLHSSAKTPFILGEKSNIDGREGKLEPEVRERQGDVETHGKKELVIKGLVERREKTDNIHYEHRNHGAKTKRPRNAKRKKEGEGERGLK